MKYISKAVLGNLRLCWRSTLVWISAFIICCILCRCVDVAYLADVLALHTWMHLAFIIFYMLCWFRMRYLDASQDVNWSAVLLHGEEKSMLPNTQHTTDGRPIGCVSFRHRYPFCGFCCGRFCGVDFLSSTFLNQPCIVPCVACRFCGVNFLSSTFVVVDFAVSIFCHRLL